MPKGNTARPSFCSQFAHDRTTRAGTERQRSTWDDPWNGISRVARATLGSRGRQPVRVRVSPLARPDQRDRDGSPSGFRSSLSFGLAERYESRGEFCIAATGPRGKDVHMCPETRYARNCSVSLPYQVVGDGPRDLLLVSEFLSNIEFAWMYRNTCRSAGGSRVSRGCSECSGSRAGPPKILDTPHSPGSRTT
jgi:hypothetical protein